MAAVVDVYNMALGRIGVFNKRVNAIDEATSPYQRRG